MLRTIPETGKIFFSMDSHCATADDLSGVETGPTRTFLVLDHQGNVILKAVNFTAMREPLQSSVSSKVMANKLVVYKSFTFTLHNSEQLQMS